MPTTPQPDKPPAVDGPMPPTLDDSGQPHPTAVPQPAAGGSLVLAAGLRPLPDYELIAPLGRGGFGEVWKARGPGGFDVALKFIRLGNEAGKVELRALEVMKGVRHANLLPLFGAWQRDGLLVVAMELADGTLLDRLRQAKAQGLSGIPRDELLEHLRDAARGLDFLNEYRAAVEGGGEVVGIQHKDVKPHNLLLVGGVVKVADFGLAKMLEHTVTAATGGRTPAYAAPEFFNGQAARWSDQYSLAVVYCELRGGRLPFEGNEFQMMAGHVMQPPDLTMLPEAERPAVARALAKKPEERWPSCRAFAEALAEAGRRVPPPPEPVKVVAEGEALLARRCREALERAGGKLTPEDRTALAALCRGYGIPAERANAITREARVRWEKEHPGRRAGEETRPTAPPSVAQGVQPPAPPDLRPGPAQGLPLPWLLAVAVPLGAAALVGVILLVALSGGPASDTRQTSSITRTTGPGSETHPEIVKPAVGPERGKPFTNSVGMQMAWIKPGSFTMGSPADEPERSDDETPHRVTLTKGFHMGTCLVTQAQWEQVLGKDADEKQKLPVDNVSWDDCQEFCRKLGALEGRTYKLPTEAQWEYACRAGTQTPFWWGSTITTDRANYDGTSTYGKDGQRGENRGKTTPVDFFPANPWGLHDMGGNLYQWCEDWYAPYPPGEQIYPLNI